jgi:hypothetical protein
MSPPHGSTELKSSPLGFTEAHHGFDEKDWEVYGLLKVGQRF